METALCGNKIFLYTVAKIPQHIHSFYGHSFIVEGIAYIKHSYSWYIEIHENTCNMGDIEEEIVSSDPPEMPR